MSLASNCRHAALSIALSLGMASAHGACLVSATSMAFGSLPLLGASSGQASTATITLTCVAMTAPANYSIALGPGGSGAVQARTMNTLLGGGSLAYNLYLDPAYTTVWGDTSSGSVAAGTVRPNALLAGTATHTVYGKLAIQQPALRPGTYSDSLTLTVSYDP